jgi:hypothetical protein
MKYGTNKDQVRDYLKARNFPKDSNDPKTIIIDFPKGKVDCWLSWRGSALEIASQVFDSQSAWCATIAKRLHQLFPCDCFGADSTGWWEKDVEPHRPFYFTIKSYSNFKGAEKELKALKNRQRQFINAAKRFLPNE